eukprot:m.21311 g.21311  ORF g.21311 m.21311 type:complete len:245 (+) comp28158_c0_seq2:10-744(+)
MASREREDRRRRRREKSPSPFGGEGKSERRSRDAEGPRRRHSRSPRRRRSRSRSRERDRHQIETHPGTEKFGKLTDEKKKDEEETKDKPDFGLSGKLAEDTNTYRGVVIKYSEPPEAKVPKKRWRFYTFKGDQTLDTLYIHRQSAYLVGRDRNICDIPLLHPSISSQHAVLQYRLVDHEKQDGSMVKKVKPYVIDLESTNGTYVNNNRIDSSRYIELLEKDMLKFGFSSREYILLHENSAESVS